MCFLNLTKNKVKLLTNQYQLTTYIILINTYIFDNFKLLVIFFFVFRFRHF